MRAPSSKVVSVKDRELDKDIEWLEEDARERSEKRVEAMRQVNRVLERAARLSPAEAADVPPMVSEKWDERQAAAQDALEIVDTILRWFVPTFPPPGARERLRELR